MVYGFAKQSGGYVKICSEVGQGTSVKLYLPRLILEREPPVTNGSARVAQGEAERVLLAEDEELVGYHVGSQLTTLGYEVVAVAAGNQALDSIRQGGNFNLLFTNIVMPGGIDGKQLADAVRQLPVLFTSGYAANAIGASGQLDPGVSLLSTPYSRVD